MATPQELPEGAQDEPAHPLEVPWHQAPMEAPTSRVPLRSVLMAFHKDSPIWWLSQLKILRVWDLAIFKGCFWLCHFVAGAVATSVRTDCCGGSRWTLRAANEVGVIKYRTKMLLHCAHKPWRSHSYLGFCLTLPRWTPYGFCIPMGCSTGSSGETATLRHNPQCRLENRNSNCHLHDNCNCKKGTEYFLHIHAANVLLLKNQQFASQKKPVR